MWKKITKGLHRVSDVLEIVMAVVLAAAAIISIIGLVPQIPQLVYGLENTAGLMTLLKEIFNVIIAIEFLKMLCKPTADTIIEVLIFLVARHMIIGVSSAQEDLLSVVSIGILFLIQHYLKYGGLRRRAEKDKIEEEKAQANVQAEATECKEEKGQAKTAK